MLRAVAFIATAPSESRRVVFPSGIFAPGFSHLAGLSVFFLGCSKDYRAACFAFAFVVGAWFLSKSPGKSWVCGCALTFGHVPSPVALRGWGGT